MCLHCCKENVNQLVCLWPRGQSSKDFFLGSISLPPKQKFWAGNIFTSLVFGFKRRGGMIEMFAQL